MRKVMFVLALVSGCASESSTDGTTLSGVMVVDQATLDAHHWYMDHTVSEAPVLASEVADVDVAVSVRLLTTSGFVAAVSIHGIEGAWPIVNNQLADTQPGSVTPETTTPTSGGAAVHDFSGAGFATITEDTIIVAWSDGFTLTPEELEQLQAIHPGCI